VQLTVAVPADVVLAAADDNNGEPDADELATASLVVVVLFAVLTSRPAVVAVAITVYVPGRVGAVRVVATFPDAPGGSVPTLILAARDAVPAAAVDIVTTTECAVPRPRLLTVSWSRVVAPLLSVAAPSVRELGTMSASGAAAALNGRNNRVTAMAAAVDTVHTTRNPPDTIGIALPPRSSFRRRDVPPRLR
jgi:hypothetical protein